MGSSALVVVISIHGYFSLIAFYSALYCMPKRELFTLCMLVMYLDVVLCCTAEPLFSYAIMCVVCAFCDLFVQPCLCDGILVLLEMASRVGCNSFEELAEMLGAGLRMGDVESSQEVSHQLVLWFLWIIQITITSCYPRM
jgi:hypothetical protein